MPSKIQTTDFYQEKNRRRKKKKKKRKKTNEFATQRPALF
jgi:hypothetical protein